jgi:hypothetical protein
MKINFFAFVYLIIVIVLVGCQDKTVKAPSDFPSALLVASAAKNVNYRIIDGTPQVNYQVTTCYPGDEVIKEIEQKMTEKNWKLLTEDFLNPGLKSTRKWSQFRDTKNNYIYQIIEDWKDAQGNIVRYGLRYLSKTNQNPSSNCLMEVNGIYVNKELLNKILLNLK